ncbi:MAG: hypothetical protein COZ20_01690 [Gallionellales bacterium CG_4_10_14_3_um_filter_54_96]|nr:MAG: hypothetical protein COW45_06295 [Gallionellales bacterium CG17_big_fil_post_rev_8_21_14_2_50_54_146]PIX03952.1 MAG: hypothetical protein COZ77_09060 [Gallionellales bacterium CG_4_8_14_3_um_filter_54_18]PIY06338.1 MAG: hypothetical protein COZ20_01690 [Gallionellales bacterium CG_4_10_14_3_um_filter_54_96]PJC05625.1 MAG: hypothetical protein CO070_01630 [Gallionellales bacterium CG_4_9_14_0_8_um_filter_55_61]
MDNNNISERLKALSRGKNRSATARLREIFDDIEAALSAKVLRKDVHQALVESGFEITFESFELVIYRIRKGRRENKHATKTTSGGEKNFHHAASGGNTGKTVTCGSRRPQLLSNDKGIYGDLNPSPVDGIVDFKQK